jgi:predicted nucleic acid-binding protein
VAVNELVIDACALINLLSTGDEDRLVGALGMHLVTTSLARAEVRFRRGPPDDEGVPTQVPLDVDRLIREGSLSVRPMDGAVRDAFVAAVSAGLRDADASVVALAGTSGTPLASDDNRVRKIAPRLYPSLQLRSTLGLVRDAYERIGVTPSDLRDFARRLSSGGNFLPPKSDEHRVWFSALLEDVQ